MKTKQVEIESKLELKRSATVKKVLFLLLTIFTALLIPIFIQYPLNVWFRDTFQEGWLILKSELRVVSTLVCYVITAAAGWILLHFSGIKKWWLTILFFVLTFLWTVLIAVAEWLSID